MDVQFDFWLPCDFKTSTRRLHTLSTVKLLKQLIYLKIHIVLLDWMESLSNELISYIGEFVHRPLSCLVASKALAPICHNKVIYADISPIIVPFVKRLVRECDMKEENITIVYWNDASYITCRLIEKHIKCAKFEHAFFPKQSNYQVPLSLLTASSPEDLYDLMSPPQQLLWYNT